MNLTVSHKQNPFLYLSTPLIQTYPNSILLRFPSKCRSTISRQKLTFSIFSSASPNGSDGFSWPRLTRDVRLGSERFLLKLGESVKRETGFDFDGTNVKVGELVERIKGQVKKGEAELARFRTELLPEFLDWNKWERWKKFRK